MFEFFHIRPNYMGSPVRFLYSIHYVNSKICVYAISHDETFSPALSVLSKLFGIARALMTVETNTNTSLKTFSDALSCRVAGQT